MKYIQVSLDIYNLYKELERLELDLNFSVFYSFAESLKSHHYCPAFEVGKEYYEIQTDSENKLQVLRFNMFQEEGVILTKKEILELVQELKQINHGNTNHI